MDERDVIAALRVLQKLQRASFSCRIDRRSAVRWGGFDRFQVGMAASLAQWIRANGLRRSVRVGETLTCRGERADSAFLVERGSVVLHSEIGGLFLMLPAVASSGPIRVVAWCAALSVMLLSLTGCGCVERDADNRWSADGAYRARAFYRACGPKNVSFVVLIRAGERGDVRLISSRRAIFTIEWTGPRELKVTFLSTSVKDVTRAMSEAVRQQADVRIQYYVKRGSTVTRVP